MNKKTALDMAIVVSCITGIALTWFYLENPIEKQINFTVLGVICFIFLIFALTDAREGKQWPGDGRRKKEISELLLLGEEGNVTAVWDIYGKTSIVFGKDERENQVDINLKNTDYSGTVDGEHAVMNYSGGGWYIEDLDSENGTRIQKAGEQQKYRVSSREPCRVDRNDIIYLGLAPIKIQYYYFSIWRQFTRKYVLQNYCRILIQYIIRKYSNWIKNVLYLKIR